MRFANINVLIFLWVIPLLIVFFIWSIRKSSRLMEIFFANKLLIKSLVPEGIQRIRITRAVLIIIAVILCFIALARPQYGFRWEDIKRKGVDIVVALDVSESMMAQDVDPNRLERAKREIIDLLRMLQGDRVGLVAFAGSSFIQCPLTLDYNAFSIFLNSLSPDLIPVPGTDMSEAIDTAVSAFNSKLNSSKAIIFITDGEDHSGTALEEAKKAKDKEIKIFTIGIGTADGVPIPISGSSGGFKKNDKGEMVLTHLDTDALKNIALSTGGIYVNSVSGDMDLKAIYLKGIKKGMKQSELSSKRQKKWKERFQWPLLVALILLFVEESLESRRAGNNR